MRHNKNFKLYTYVCSYLVAVSMEFSYFSMVPISNDSSLVLSIVRSPEIHVAYYRELTRYMYDVYFLSFLLRSNKLLTSLGFAQTPPINCADVCMSTMEL